MPQLLEYMNRCFDWVAWGMLAIAPVVFILLLFVRAPYGRYVRGGWGPVLDARVGWFVMEAAAVVVPAAIVLCYATLNAAVVVLLGMWSLHYCHRAFVYPWTLPRNRKMPWAIMLLALVFNTINGYLNGWSLVMNAERYDWSWLATPQFVVGVVLFFGGMTLNKVADAELSRLARAKATDGVYRIPTGVVYRRVSCPNYLGEIIQWTGWAIATWSLAGLVFAVWTVANLAPRAIAHHRWYRTHLADYPPDRRALLPFIL